MKNVMVRWSSTADFLIILIIGLAHISETLTKKRSPQEQWEHFNTNLQSGEWHPMVFGDNGPQEIFRRPLPHHHAVNGDASFSSSDQKSSNQNLQRRYHLTQTQAFPPNAVVNINSRQQPPNLAPPPPERKSFQLSSVSSPNRLEKLASVSSPAANRLENSPAAPAPPTILGAFNSIGLHMVQNRLPPQDNNQHKNQLQQSSFTYHGKPPPSPSKIFSQHSNNRQNNNNAFKQDDSINFNNRQPNGPPSPNKTPQLQMSAPPQPSIVSSVQAYPPPDRRNPFLSNDAQQQHYHQQGGAHMQLPSSSKSNIDSESLPSRKQIHHQQQQQSFVPSKSSPFLTDNNAIPTIYGTRDTFNLPTIYKPAPFSKNAQFEEFPPAPYNDNNEFLINSRNPYKDHGGSSSSSTTQLEEGGFTSDEQNPSRQVFEQLSKYGRPFTNNKDSNYNNQLTSSKKVIQQQEVHPTVKSGQYAIQTNYKGDDRRPISVGNDVDYYQEENAKQSNTQKTKHRQNGGQQQQYVNLEIHSSPISFSSSSSSSEESGGQSAEEQQQQQHRNEGQQHRNEGQQLSLKNKEDYVKANGNVRIQNKDNEYSTTNRPSSTTRPFLPTRTDHHEYDVVTLNTAAAGYPSTIDVTAVTQPTTIPANHKYEQTNHRQTTTRKNYPYRYKETSRRPNNNNNRPTTESSSHIAQTSASLEDSSEVKQIVGSSAAETYYHPFISEENLSQKRRKVRPPSHHTSSSSSPTDLQQYRISSSSTTATSLPVITDISNINDAFYDTDDIQQIDYHRQRNGQDKKSQSKTKPAATSVASEEDASYKINKAESHETSYNGGYQNYYPTANQYEGVRQSSSGVAEEAVDNDETATPVNSLAYSAATANAVTAPTETTIILATTSSSTTTTTEEPPVSTNRSKVKGKQTSSNRPKFSIKEYKTRSSTTTTTTIPTTVVDENLSEENRPPPPTTRKPYGSFVASRLKTSTVTTTDVVQETTPKNDARKNNEQDESSSAASSILRKYRPKLKASSSTSSRYRTGSSSTTINPLLESTTTERAHTFRPTGKSRYKSNGTRQYSKYRTTTEVVSNELLQDDQQLVDELQSSSDKHAIKTKPTFSAKRSSSNSNNNNANSVSTTKRYQQQQQQQRQEEQKNIDDDQNADAGNEIKKLFPKKNPMMAKFKERTSTLLNKKSDKEEDIKIMTSSEEVAEGKKRLNNNTAKPSVSAKTTAADDEWEYYEEEEEEEEPKTSASNKEEQVVSLESNPRIEENSYNVDGSPRRPEIRSSSMSRNPSSYVADESMPPVDAYFRSWYESEKRKTH